ncbi:MAG: hypothetical protein AAGI68_15755 [Planctomycetota bacterium]
MLIYCCADLIFATRVRAAAEDAGLTSRPVRNPDMLTARLDRIDDGKPNAPVSLFIADLENPESLNLINQLRGWESEQPEAAPIAVIAFGPHVMTDALQAAQDAGATRVMTRGSFTSALPALLQTAAAQS